MIITLVVYCLSEMRKRLNTYKNQLSIYFTHNLTEKDITLNNYMLLVCLYKMKLSNHFYESMYKAIK